MLFRPGSRRAWTMVAALFATLAFALTSPTFSASAADLDEVVTAFTAGEHVFIEEGAPDEVTLDQLRNVVIRAANGGIDLYIAVLAEGSDRVNAELVRDALGEVTVAVFTPSQYRLASADVCTSRFDEARATADAQLGQAQAHEAAGAFIDAVLTLPPCDEGGGLAGLPWWGFLLGLLAFALLGLFVVRAMGQSRRATETARGFAERRDVLRDWALSLRQPITDLQAPVSSARSAELTRMYSDALDIAKASEAEVMGATGMPDLDRVEMRIARAQMQIRDLHKALGTPATQGSPQG